MEACLNRPLHRGTNPLSSLPGMPFPLSLSLSLSFSLSLSLFTHPHNHMDPYPSPPSLSPHIRRRRQRQETQEWRRNQEEHNRGTPPKKPLRRVHYRTTSKEAPKKTTLQDHLQRSPQQIEKPESKTLFSPPKYKTWDKNKNPIKNNHPDLIKQIKNVKNKSTCLMFKNNNKDKSKQ